LGEVLFDVAGGGEFSVEDDRQKYSHFFPNL
jgi:hypothetical protein